MRFVQNCRPKKQRNSELHLSTLKLQKAETYWLATTQVQHFAMEITNLKKGRQLHKSSPLISLHPFIDPDNVIRVGGREQNSNRAYSTQHPVILRGSHPITRQISSRSGRSTRKPVIVKSYVCVFVSLSVRAVHLELVSDLSTDAFIACLRRFISRRGKPSLLCSDHGTNFVGAASEIKELVKFLEFQKTQEKIFTFCSVQNIQWKFIPGMNMQPR